MEMDWPDVLKSALIYGLPVLIIGLWAAHRRKEQKENEKISEVLRKTPGSRRSRATADTGPALAASRPVKNRTPS